MTGHIVAVRPHADLRVIDEVRGVGDEIVKIVCASGVLRLRDGDALMREIGARTHDKLRENPAPAENIICDDRIAVVVCGAVTAERLKERVASGRPVKQRACRFIENSETGIVPLDILFRADPAVGIWWIARGTNPASPTPTPSQLTPVGVGAERTRPKKVCVKPARGVSVGG